MAKNPSKQKPQKKETPISSTPGVKAETTGFSFARSLPYLVVFIFSFSLYANTLLNDYALDDEMTLTGNKFVLKGFDGIKDVFTHDMAEGFFGEQGATLINGGRYRPLTMVTFAVEYGLYGLNPKASHAINVLLFALTIATLLYLLQLIIPGKYAWKTSWGNWGIPFIAAMLYAAHPLHVEAVANIKGRDEVMCMLLSLLALIAAVKYVQTQKPIHLAWGIAIYFTALLSKENALTFFAVIPLTYFFFTKANTKNYLLAMGLYLIPIVIFLSIRAVYTQSGLTNDSTTVLNNPFALATTSQRYATTILTFLYYFKLLIFPHPLTHDYYYNQIPYVDFTSILFIVSLLINLGLLVYALINLKKKSIISYCILFYFITFSIASNLLFTVGTTMNDRFIYMSSLGFCLLVAYLLFNYIQNKKALVAVLTVTLLLYSVKTYTRNFDWKDNLTLFGTDVSKSPNSTKIHTLLAQALILESRKQTDTVVMNRMLDSSIAHLHTSLSIYNEYPFAWLDLGTAIYSRSHDANASIAAFREATKYYTGEFYEAYLNIGLVASQTNQIELAKDYLLKASAIKPSELTCQYPLPQLYAKLNRPDSVEYWVNRILQAKPLLAGDYYLIGMDFAQVGNNPQKAAEYISKAISMDPQQQLYYENLAVVYIFLKQYDQSISVNEQLLKLNPNYTAAYKNLASAYELKGNIAQAKAYRQKYSQLTGIPIQ